MVNYYSILYTVMGTRMTVIEIDDHRSLENHRVKSSTIDDQ